MFPLFAKDSPKDFELLPDEIAIYILTMLPHKDIIKFSVMNKRFEKLSFNALKSKVLDIVNKQSGIFINGVVGRTDSKLRIINGSLRGLDLHLSLFATDVDRFAYWLRTKTSKACVKVLIPGNKLLKFTDMWDYAKTRAVYDAPTNKWIAEDVYKNFLRNANSVEAIVVTPAVAKILNDHKIEIKTTSLNYNVTQEDILTTYDLDANGGVRSMTRRA